MENPIEPSIESLFQELRKRARQEGISTYEEYIELVDGIVMEKLDDGHFLQDEDLVQIRIDLEQRWLEIKEELEKDVAI
jgi:hypothetical protein